MSVCRYVVSTAELMTAWKRHIETALPSVRREWYGSSTFQLASEGNGVGDACPQQPSAAVAFKFKSRFLPWEISAEINGNGAHGVERGRK
jgi:hypothetical protein